MLKYRYVPLLAVVLLVVLRMAIGWQFMYEGLWKKNTQTTAQPWSAEGFLKNAEGPFRDTFRGMVGDPDELKWLDEEAVNARWDAWQERFTEHYGLTDKQKEGLDILLNGEELYYSDPGRYPVTELPPKVAEFLGENGKGKNWDRFFRFNKEKKWLEVDGADLNDPKKLAQLTPKEKAQLIWLAGLEEKNPLPLDPNEFTYQVVVLDVEGQEEKERPEPTEVQVRFAKALDHVYARQAKLGFRERLKATLNGDPEMVGPLYATKIKDEKGEEKKVTEDLKGNAEQYERLLERFDAMHSDAELAYNWTHLDYEKTKLLEQKAKAIGPIKSLDAELRTAALKLLTLDQLSNGPVARDPEPVHTQDFLVITGLLVLGFCLIAGLFTKLAVVLGAVMIISFYLVMPPWPGVPEAPGPEHSYIVNKNLIEFIALLAIAAFPTGVWFGIDGALLSLWRKMKSGKKTEPPKTETESPKATAAT